MAKPSRANGKDSVISTASVSEAFTKLQERWGHYHNEEEVRTEWLIALRSATGLTLHAERGRVDTSHNNVFIEFKDAGFFKSSPDSAKFKEATRDRLLPYIQRDAAKKGTDESDYIGIAVDGAHVAFAQVRGGVIHSGPLLPADEHAFGMVVDALLGNSRRYVTAENLIEDFGHNAKAAIAVMQILSDALAEALNGGASPKIRMLFEEWKELYGQVADLSGEQKKTIADTLRFAWNGPAEFAISGRLFVIHTYNSLLIKLLAAEVVAAHNLTGQPDPALTMCGFAEAGELTKFLDEQIERGDLFRGASIRGFVEEAIFSWHLDVARLPDYQDDLTAALKEVLGKLALYRTDRLEHQRDTLRDFYQDLVPEAFRKSLGEFYTPDWLAEFTVNKVAPADWLGPRCLDPTCGSGAFLIELIRRKREAAKAVGMSADELLDRLCDEVWGFDLNPLAVQTARVNFLMEIADLMADAPGKEVELPVLLADSIYSPAPDPATGRKVVVYSIGGPKSDLEITLPVALAFDRARLDAVLEIMGEMVADEATFDDVLEMMRVRGALNQREEKQWAKPLRATYERVLGLHRKNWNGIWFRIVRNFFWSATAGEFDLVVGNPPWVRWSRLPALYRQRVKPTCEQYDIFSKTKHHGGNELDISAMITYTVADKWLKAGGKLAFIITQAVFQNPSSAGFRKFRIQGDTYLTPQGVDDLQRLKPFPDAANKTAVAVFQKSNAPPAYPVPYNVWNAQPGKSRTIRPTLKLAEVMDKLVSEEREANPVQGKGSPWAILPPGRFETLRAISTFSEEVWVEGRKGITTDLNGVYFVSIVGTGAAGGPIQIRNRPGAGKKSLGAARTQWVEPDWLYPLIKGAADFKPCRFQPAEELFAIVPNRGIRRADYATAEREHARMPKMRAYLRPYCDLLNSRSTWKGRMRATGAPEYAIYNVGAFTFKPWKVIWAEMSGRFGAAVAGSAPVPSVARERPYIPDHKIFFVALDDKTEAHYLCGLLNSELVREYVESHNVAIQVGDIFKHMRLPPYRAGEREHRRLAELVEQAHAQDDPAEHATLLGEIRRLANEVIEQWAQAEPAPGERNGQQTGEFNFEAS